MGPRKRAMSGAAGEGPQVPPIKTFGGRAVPVLCPSPRSKQAIAMFRAKLREHFSELPDDMTLLRFLRARQLDLELATTMYMNHRHWRTSFETDTIIWDYDFPERDRVLQVYPCGYHKTGRTGHPIYIERVGQLDVDALLQITTVDRYIRYHVQAYEDMLMHKLPACSLAAQKPVSQSMTILDLDGISMSFLLSSNNQELLKRVISLDQDNYPECLHKMFVVNAPRMFTMAYSLIKNFIDPVTREKIQIFGSSFISELEKHIDIHDIPTFLGGKCNCKGGCLHIQPGPWDQYPPSPRQMPVDGFSTPRHPPPASENNTPSATNEERGSEDVEWIPIAPTRIMPMGSLGVRFSRRTQRRGMLKTKLKDPDSDMVVYKTINCWGGIYSNSNTSRMRARASSKTERMEDERRILQDMARASPGGPDTVPAPMNVSLAFAQAAAARNIDDLARALAAGSAPNHDGMIQVKLGSGLFPKWAQLFVSVAGGVLVCKEAPWAKDALAPASLLQATGVTISHGRYIKVEGLHPAFELWHEEEQEAMTWFITLWCSRIMSRVAAHLTALDQDQAVQWWSQELTKIDHVLVKGSQGNDVDTDGKSMVSKAANATLAKARDLKDKVFHFF